MLLKGAQEQRKIPTSGMPPSANLRGCLSSVPSVVLQWSYSLISSQNILNHYHATHFDLNS